MKNPPPPQKPRGINFFLPLIADTKPLPREPPAEIVEGLPGYERLREAADGDRTLASLVAEAGARTLYCWTFACRRRRRYGRGPPT